MQRVTERDRKQPKKVVFLKGRKIILRPLCKETDLAACHRWMNDPDVSYYIQRYLPITLGEEVQWFDDLSKRKEDVVLAIETRGGAFIGVIGLHRINWKDRTAVTGACIGEKEYWGRGYGTDAKMALLGYAFQTLNLRKITSMVYAFNKRSLAYNLHCGYCVEGVQKRQVFKRGRYYDVVQLGLFKKDWLPIWRRYKKIGSIR